MPADKMTSQLLQHTSTIRAVMATTACVPHLAQASHGRPPTRAGASAPRSLAQLRAQCRSAARSEPGRPAAQPAGGAVAIGRPASQSQGAEETMNAAYIRGAIRVRRRARRRTPSSAATSLTLRSAQGYIGRVIGRAQRAELLRALNQPKAMPALQQRRRPSRKLARGRDARRRPQLDASGVTAALRFSKGARGGGPGGRRAGRRTGRARRLTGP